MKQELYFYEIKFDTEWASFRCFCFLLWSVWPVIYLMVLSLLVLWGLQVKPFAPEWMKQNKCHAQELAK